MSLFDEGTVIIVGAGASVPFGLPTGAELIDLIIHSLRHEASKLQRIAENRPYSGFYPALAPISYALTCNGDPSAQIDPEVAAASLIDAANWLSLQTGDSVDDIIRHNPSRAQLLKVGICYALILRSYRIEEEPRAYILRQLTERNVKFEVGSEERYYRNWVHHFINLVRSEIISEINDFGRVRSKVKVISFNYDCLLEHVLDVKWGSIENDLGSWSEFIEIVHPHGLIEMPEKILEHELAAYLLSNANSIAVVHDSLDGSPAAEFTQRATARRFCKDAYRVYAIGFAFARANVSLIGLDEGIEVDKEEEERSHGFDRPKRHYHYINFNDSFGLRARVEELCNRASGWPPVDEFYPVIPEEMTAGPGRLLEISEALIAGFLGEMPS
ncbi:MAG: hypothetical protein CFE27_08925 [Alphaproteobacteria bacterium PA1]|nr:MAG: hypothetical protein CFE27_08925 [Alphaproteobacteria bacterium PA1]